MTGLRIAACQYPIERIASFEQWANKLTSWVDEASAAGAQILIFPEYGSLDTLDLVATPGGTLTEQFLAHQAWIPRLRAHYAALARARGVLLVAGSWLEQVEGRLRNRTWLFAPDEHSAFTDKVLLTPEERRYGLQAGESSSVFDTRFGRIGVAVCYDAEFPLLIRKLAETGAELIVVPSCTDTFAGYHRVRLGCRARALENQIYLAQAVTVGAAPWSLLLDENHGAAGVFTPPDVGFPSDGILASGTLDEPQWVYADIDVELLQSQRQLGQVRGREDWLRREHLSPTVVAKRLS